MNANRQWITKQKMDAEEPFLRFQIGIMERRRAMKPIYAGKTSRVDRHEPDDHEVTVFRLVGFGSKLELAQDMAKKARW